MQRLVDVDLELAAVEPHGDRRVAAAQRERDRRAARAGARRLRLPDAALEDPRADRAGAGGHQNETFVRFGNCGSCSIAGPIAGRSSAASSSRSATRIAHCGLPMWTCWKRRPATSPVPSGPPDGKCVRAQPRAAHVDAAGRRAEDRRADLPRRGLDRELVLRRSSRRGAGTGSPRARRCPTARPPSRRG